MIHTLLLLGWAILWSPNGSIMAAEEDFDKDRACYDQWSWRKKQSDMHGIIDIGSSSSSSSHNHMEEYRHSEEKPNFEGVTIKELSYTFWNNRLYAITLKTNGKNDLNDLKNKIVSRFNHSKSPSSPENGVWIGTNTITRSSYDDKTNIGQIKLISYTLNRQLHLAKFLPSNVYSSWLKQKRGMHRK